MHRVDGVAVRRVDAEPITEVERPHRIAIETLIEALSNVIAAPNERAFQTLSCAHPKIDLLRALVPVVASFLLGCGFEARAAVDEQLETCHFAFKQGSAASHDACLEGLDELTKLDRALHLESRLQMTNRLAALSKRGASAGGALSLSPGGTRTNDRGAEHGAARATAEDEDANVQAAIAASLHEMVPPDAVPRDSEPLCEGCDGDGGEEEELKMALAMSMGAAGNVDGDSCPPPLSPLGVRVLARARDRASARLLLNSAASPASLVETASVTPVTAFEAGTARPGAKRRADDDLAAIDDDEMSPVASKLQKLGPSPAATLTLDPTPSPEEPAPTPTPPPELAPKPMRSELRLPPSPLPESPPKLALETPLCYTAHARHTLTWEIERPAEHSLFGIHFAEEPLVNGSDATVQCSAVVVQHVVPASAAERAGVRDRDVIVAISGCRVNTQQDAAGLLQEARLQASTTPGAARSTARVTVLRAPEADVMWDGVQQLQTACPPVFERAAKTLCKVLTNVLTHDNAEAKFRRVNASLPTLLLATGSIAVLTGAGFEQTSDSATLELAPGADLTPLRRALCTVRTEELRRAHSRDCIQALRAAEPGHGYTFRGGQWLPWASRLMAQPPDLLVTSSAPRLRFAISAHVRVKLGTWRVGRVTQHHFWQTDFPEGRVAAYQVEIVGTRNDAYHGPQGMRVMAPQDTDDFIRGPQRFDRIDATRRDPHSYAMVDTLMDMSGALNNALGLNSKGQDSRWMRAVLEDDIGENGVTEHGQQWLADLRREGNSERARQRGVDMFLNSFDAPRSPSRRTSDAAQSEEDGELQRALALSLQDLQATAMSGKPEHGEHSDYGIDQQSRVQEVPPGVAGPSQAIQANPQARASSCSDAHQAGGSERARGKRRQVDA